MSPYKFCMADMGLTSALPAPLAACCLQLPLGHKKKGHTIVLNVLPWVIKELNVPLGDSGRVPLSQRGINSYINSINLKQIR